MPTWTGLGANNDWSTGGNWDTGSAPTAAQPAIFNGVGISGNKNCIITLNATCSDFILTGYSGQIQFTNTLTVNMTATGGNITFSAALGFSMVGPNGISYNLSITSTTRTITSNGYFFNLPFSMLGVGGSTLILNGDFQVSNFTGFNVSINGPGEFRVSGNWSSTALGTALKVLNGNGTMNTNSGAQNLVINAPGFTRIFSGNIFITSTLLWIAGTTVTTGSTFTFNGMTNINMGGIGQPLNNVTFFNVVATTTFATDLYILGNFATGNANVYNSPGKIYVAGDFSSPFGSPSGSAIIEMNGTSSTISNPTNLNFIINTAGVITLASTARFNGNLTLTAGTLNVTNPLRKSGGLLTITSGITFTGGGDLIFVGSVPGVVHSVTSNGITWPYSMQITPDVNITNDIITFNDTFTVAGNVTSNAPIVSANTHTLNGSNLQINGNLIINHTGGLLGTSTIVLQGSSSSNWTHVVTSPIQNNLTINKTGGASVTVSGNITWGAASRTLNLNSNANFTTNNVTLTLSGTPLTITNASNSQFYNLTTAAGAQTININ